MRVEKKETQLQNPPSPSRLPWKGGLQPASGISPGPAPGVPYNYVASIGTSGTRLYLSLPYVTGRAGQGCSGARSYQLAQKRRLAAGACRLS